MPEPPKRHPKHRAIPTEKDLNDGVLLFDQGRASHKASQDCIDAIRKELSRGYGFVPFIGAGFSVSAGIPIIQQLKVYLHRCICVALGVENELDTVDINGKAPAIQLWNPRTDRWPPLVDRRRAEPIGWIDCMKRSYEREQKKLEQGDDGHPWLYLEALGAMAEWRTSLYFLSRLLPNGVRRRGSTKLANGGVKMPSLGVPSQEVVDACFREVMRDRRPSLNHNMLAAVSGLLRIDLILTTNFDDLLEQAFENSRNPLQVFDVHLRDALPDLSAVSRVRSIIKLHGTQSSLRADYSLDGEPSYEDTRHFAEYLCGQRLLSPSQATKNHLLVLGVGATERRTISFIHSALKALPNLKVFWVCYSDAEIASVRRFVSSCTLREMSINGSVAKVSVLRHTEAGLLFLHMYQSIRKTLPATDAIYPSVTRLSLPPLPQQHTVFEKSARYKRFRDSLKVHIETTDLTIATAAKDVPGVTTACAAIFRELETKHVCIWIEMNDIHSVDELFETIQETAYRKLGQIDWTPLYAAKDHRPRELEIKRIADASSKPWLIFINARELPGANRTDDVIDNGWLDNETGTREVRDLIKELSDARKGTIKVVLLCRNVNSGLVKTPYRFADRIVLLQDTHTETPEQVLEKTLRWTDDPTGPRGRFLHALSLMQRSRHLAIAWSRSVRPQGSFYFSADDSKRMQWLNELHNDGLLRWKDGAFLWFHSNLRQKLRQTFERNTTCAHRSEI